jgi:hypothetical protein
LAYHFLRLKMRRDINNNWMQHNILSKT